MTGSAALSGILLGLSAGLAPGPLMVFVIAQTLRHGAAEGARAALAPLVTDLPIVAACLWLISRAANAGPLPALMSLAGGLYLLYLGLGALRPAPSPAARLQEAPASLRKAVLINALSPHPYLFWSTVGGPLVVRAAETSTAGPVWFVTSFYACLVGAKVAVALASARFRHALAGRWYRNVNLALGMLLAAFGLLLLHDAWVLSMTAAPPTPS